jgi:pilus assembly protein CpaB
MRGRNLLIVGAAVFIGLLAVYLANTYFSGVEQRETQVAEQQRLDRIVVASQALEFGDPLTSTNLRLMNWPANSVPAGAFTSIEQATNGGRVALRPIVAGEPVLASKVSGTDGRATLAANLPRNMRAVAIPVNDVAGVGGFVRPGDVVDVLLTRQIPGEGSQTNDKMTTVVLENALVLGTDQVLDESDTEPKVGKTATLQTDIYGAQKLALAVQVGTLSLALRNVADQNVGETRPVIARDLGGAGLVVRGRGTGGGGAQDPGSAIVNALLRAEGVVAGSQGGTAAATAPRRPTGPTMTVVRGTEGEAYEVERYGAF